MVPNLERLRHRWVTPQERLIQWRFGNRHGFSMLPIMLLTMELVPPRGVHRLSTAQALHSSYRVVESASFNLRRFQQLLLGSAEFRFSVHVVLMGLLPRPKPRIRSYNDWVWVEHARGTGLESYRRSFTEVAIWLPLISAETTAMRRYVEHPSLNARALFLGTCKGTSSITDHGNLCEGAIERTPHLCPILTM